MSDNQAYVSDLPTMPVIPSELAQETRQHAQKPHLQLFGEEVRTYFNIIFSTSEVLKFKFQGSFVLLKILENSIIIYVDYIY